jgi:signal transduction histidine kinase
MSTDETPTVTRMKDVAMEVSPGVPARESPLARQRALVSKLRSAGSPQSVLAEWVLAQLELSQERQTALRDCWDEVHAQSYSRSKASGLGKDIRRDLAVTAPRGETTADSFARAPSGTFLQHAQLDLTDHMQAALLDLSSLKIMRSEHASEDLVVLDAVRSSFTAMQLLIHDLRFSGGSKRDVPPSRVLHSVVHLARDACKTIEPIARAAGIKLDISSIANKVAVRGDREALLQVLENLLVAAIGSAPLCASIEISARLQSGSTYFCLSPVMSKQSDSLASRERTGSSKPHKLKANLSVWIAKQIVEAHEGRLWTERSDAEVTSLRFTIPSSRSFE